MAKAIREILGVTPSTASTADSTLLIIDPQNEYAEGQLKIPNIEPTRKAISVLLEKYRAASSPIIHILHRTPPDAPVFTPNTTLSLEFAELAPRPSEKVIWKHHPGSFSGTDLEEYLKATGRNKVVLTGFMAHVCVSTTARQADERGFDVVVAEGAVGDRDIPGAEAEEVVRGTLRALGDAFASVVLAESIN